MRIELDQNEIVAILTEWGKTKYGTHNVSVDTLTNSSAILSITLSDVGFGNGATKITMEKFNELAKQMKNQEDIIPARKELFIKDYDALANGSMSGNLSPL